MRGRNVVQRTEVVQCVPLEKTKIKTSVHTLLNYRLRYY
jgi:hypothetical protein